MVTIPAQFNGPQRSGNGGYVCGMLAVEHGGDGPVTSTLRQPPPLDTPLTWEREGDELRLLTTGGGIVGTAVSGSFEREPVPCPTEAEAAAGLAAYPGFDEHPFEHCFTCGTARTEGDGLRVFAGPVGDGRTATPWSAHASFAESDGAVATPVAWAALDCPGAWTVDVAGRPMVLGRMTAEVFRRPSPGEPLLVTGRIDDQDGRKFFTATALYTREGELLGRAEHTWIEIKVADFS